MLESDPAIKVIGSARNGEEAIQKIRQLKPDLVTMDIEMPQMDGLTALKKIMATDPVPVMMVSSLTSDGAQATLDALEAGAVDFIPKQMSYVSLDIVKIKDELLAKIKDIVRRKHILMVRFRHQAGYAKTASNSRPSLQPVSKVRHPVPPKRQHHISLIAIGSSTGGPPALQEVIGSLPRNLPCGIIVAQHMPAAFTASLAARLNSKSELEVREADDGEPIEPGNVLISPGGQHLTVKRYGGKMRAVVSEKPDDTLYKPCVDVMFNAVAESIGRASMGVVLTGMGNNGVVGAAALKEKGAVMIAQDEQSSVVYGMPKAIAEAALADHICPIDQIAAEITSYF